ncbi:tetratricopeptide repeat protein [Archaeoglobus veneficus]|uniref:Tetratricopeptide TPR_1 repeat-containing protein n=1 Tax=Archaeoglobus veneficus (strain DSM 11195 / SNP6) TaxID=693661 RepID=F2KPL6_ARCVS|nr:tetratricopeptide repeat protein [Archaeoglobus veneficus]AEA47544.1 Tetratricopeptide TPR_1 repeat-containing protein [Archaeoglobus veneficus SNP6]
MDVVSEIIDMVRKGTPLSAIDVITTSAPEEIRKVAVNLFADPMCVANIDEEWKNLLLLVYFSHFSYLSEGKAGEEDISNLAVSSLTAAKLCRRLGIPDLEARFLISGGRAIYQMRMKDKAEKIFKEAEKILKELSEKDESYLPMLADVLNELAVLYMDLKRNDEAEKYLVWALEIRKSAGNEAELAETLYNAGVFYTRTKRLDIAEKYYKEGEDILRKLAKENENFLPQLGVLLNNMGVLYRKLSRFDKAEKYHREALEIFEKLSSEDEKLLKYVADTYGYLGTMYNDMMKFDEAAKYYEMAKDLYNKIERSYREKAKESTAST